ncbi:MAG: flagellar hook assembly protein FlgD [Nitrospira sp.]|nr:flagellar hook assembly protein FlgD [Nitrospira sp.]
MDPITATQPKTAITGNENVQAAVSALGSDVFLRLLVTQLQSQDPTNPVQNEDFVAQLAQFTTLEQTTGTNKLLEQLIGQDSQRTQLNLVNLIGRTVVTEGDTVSLGETDEVTLAYALSATASRVNIEVLGPNNEVIRRLTSTDFKAAGAHQIQWDGLNESGDRVPEGVYQFRVKAEDVNKQPVPNFTFARERVMNILLGTETPVVLQSGKTLHTEDIISIL